MDKGYVNPAGGSAVMGNYTLLFGKENIIVGSDLDLFQSGKGFWKVVGGGKKSFVSEMQIEKYKMYVGVI